jgi:hypothetical protein
LKTKWKALLPALLLALSLSGCGGGKLVFNPEELYTLPTLSAKYTELSSQINAILEDGAEYAAPSSGANIQPVQLADLDGDGREEAVAFFRKTDDEKPLKICIFSAAGDSYEQTAVIEGSGSAVYSVVYSDLDGDGRQELIVGWKINTELQALSVYTLDGGGTRELLRSVSYVRYVNMDLDGDGMQELIVLRADEEGDGTAEYYDWQDETLSLRSAARISMTMAELSQQGRVTVGALEDGAPALFITGVTEQFDAVTDILAVRNGEPVNILLSELTGVSGEIGFFSGLYPTDINGDGLTEVPRPVRPDGESAVQRVDWLTFAVSGEGRTVLSTYHCMEEGWYFQLPESWVGRVQTERTSSSGEAAVTFYAQDEHGRRGEALLRISAVTGTNREIRATRGSRFLLSRQKSAIYTAELPEGGESWSGGLTADEVRSAFSVIAAEWTAGDN